MRLSLMSFFHPLVRIWLLLNVVMMVDATAIPAADAWGTTDGYDVGGTRPICYVTNIRKDPNVPDMDGSNYTAIEYLNDGMFGPSNNLNDNSSQTTTNQVTQLSSVRSVLFGLFDIYVRCSCMYHEVLQYYFILLHQYHNVT